MENLREEIENIIDSDYYDSAMVGLANRIENEWIKANVIKTSDFFGHFELHECLKMEHYRIVRQCGNVQVGRNTLLTSLYKVEKLIGTIEIKFDIENKRLKMEMSC